MGNLTSKPFCEWDAALDIFPCSIYNEAVAEKDCIKGQPEVHWCSWKSPAYVSLLPQEHKCCGAILIKYGVYSGKWTRSLKDLQALNYFKMQRPFGWSDFLHSKRWYLNLWKRAELISVSIVRGDRSLCLQQKGGCFSHVPWQLCGTKRDRKETVAAL